MYRPMTEPVRGEPDLVVDGRSWVWAPNGHRRPFDRKIRVIFLKHLDGNRVGVRWASKGFYTLRYDEDLADTIGRWKVGSRHRVQMWGDRIVRVLGRYARDD